MKLAIGNDHSAVEMKKEIKKYLEDKGIEVIDVGTNSTESFNYPISGYKVGKMVANGEVDGGVLICGTGVGISLAANKVKGVRACVCSEPYSARMSKQHNNSNIIAFGARVIGVETAKMIVDADPGPEGRGRAGSVSFQAGNALQSAVWLRFFVSGRQKEPPHPGRLFAVFTGKMRFTPTRR